MRYNGYPLSLSHFVFTVVNQRDSVALLLGGVAQLVDYQLVWLWYCCWLSVLDLIFNKLFIMEAVIYFFTRAVVLVCIMVIAYIIAIPEKKSTNERDLWW